MIKRSLSFKLIAGGIIAVLVPLAVVGGFSADRSSTALRSAAEERSAMAAGSLATTVDLALRQELKNITAIATDRVFAGEDAGEMARRLSAIMKAAGADYEVIFVTDANGIIRADGVGGTEIGNDVSRRGYFVDAKNGQSTVGNPVRSMASGNPVAVTAAPIYGEGNRFVGAVCAVMKIDFLVEIVNEIRLGQTGYAFMADRAGNVIAHPRKEFILELNMKSIRGMEEITEKMLAGQSGVAPYRFDGIPKLAGFSPVPLTGWSIGLTQDAPEFLAAATQIRNIIIVTALIFLVLTGLAVFFFSRTITGPIHRIIDGLSSGAGEVASAAEQVSSASQSLAEGSSEQAASIEETSASLEEMSSMTKQNADNARQADILMGESKHVVAKANDSMGSLTRSMREIAKASEETSKIVKTIDEIAFQTNLLALNAAVEAARAGEAGAGFAVVADEVRNLAMRAAEAAKNTSSLIEGTVRKVKEGSDLVSTTNEAFGQVAVSSSKVAELVGEIAAASGEQAQGIEEVNKAVTEMDKVTQSNAANAEESASASEELNAQAEQMQAMVSELVKLVDGARAGGHVKKAAPEKARRAAPPKTRAVRKAASSPARKASGGKELDPSKLIPLDDEDFKDF